MYGLSCSVLHLIVRHRYENFFNDLGIRNILAYENLNIVAIVAKHYLSRTVVLAKLVKRCPQLERSTVQIQSSANFIYYLLHCKLYLKDKNKKKRLGSVQ